MDDTKIKEFRSDDPTSFLSNPDQRRKIDMVKTEEVKQPKKVVVPIEIPEILSVPRYRHSDAITTKHYTKLPAITPVGLSQRFTQDKLREAQIAKQLDRELANERKNSEIINEETNDL